MVCHDSEMSTVKVCVESLGLAVPHLDHLPGCASIQAYRFFLSEDLYFCFRLFGYFLFVFRGFFSFFFFFFFLFSFSFFEWVVFLFCVCFRREVFL